MKQTKLLSFLAIGTLLFINLSCGDDDTDDIIPDSNSVGLLNTSASAVEGEPAEFTVLYFGLPEDQPGDISVNYSVSGTGVSFTGTVIIPDGEQTADFSITVPEDEVLETDTVELTLSLTGADNGVGIKDDIAFSTHTFELTDDIKEISFQNDTTSISETFSRISGDTLFLPISISSPLDGSVTINYTVSGTAAAGSDYMLLSDNPLVLPANTTDTTINFMILDDFDVEDPSDLISVVIDDVVVSSSSDTETIFDNDTTYAIGYTIVDDLKTFSFERAETDTVFISQNNQTSVEVQIVLTGQLFVASEIELDLSQLPAGISTDIVFPIFDVSETSRTITLDINSDLLEGGSTGRVILNGIQTSNPENELSINTAKDVINFRITE